MPNFKIFQDVPDQVRVKIYGSNNTAFNTDASGNLTITSTGLAITTGGGTLSVSLGTGAMSVTTGSGSLSVSLGTGAMSVTTGSGSLSVSIGTGATTVTTGSGQLSISVDTRAVSDASETVANVSNTSYSGATPRVVEALPTWTFAVKNTAAAAQNQAVVKLQISPNQTDWIDEAGPVTLSQNDITALVSAVHLKYARVVYQAVNAASAVTLSIFFQAQQ